MPDAGCRMPDAGGTNAPPGNGHSFRTIFRYSGVEEPSFPSEQVDYQVYHKIFYEYKLCERA